MKTLGGSTFVWNGIKQDYNFIETLNCLYELCDEISIAVGGDDGTYEAFQGWLCAQIGEVPKYPKPIKFIHIFQSEWDSQQGREKLSYFSNKAIAALETDWNFYLQCDEIIHEDSFEYIRQAIEHDVEAYVCRRLNLWGDPYHMLDVSQERKPVSTEVIRLAKTQYRCIDDAESIGVPEAHVFGDLDLIQIFHMGFVRDKTKHIQKIKHMQRDVFLMDYDKRADLSPVFDPWQWGFSKEDVIPIPRPLPKFIQKWAEDRY
jgi:hypothetical protein